MATPSFAQRWLLPRIVGLGRGAPDRPPVSVGGRVGEWLTGIYAAIDRLERAPIRSIQYREYVDLGPLLLGAAAALMVLYVLCSTTWAFRLP